MGAFKNYLVDGIENTVSIIKKYNPYFDDDDDTAFNVIQDIIMNADEKGLIRLKIAIFSSVPKNDKDRKAVIHFLDELINGITEMKEGERR